MFLKDPLGDKNFDPYMVNFRILTWVGSWELKADSALWKKALYRMYNVTALFLFTFYPILEIIDIIKVLDDIKKVNYNLCASSGTIMLTFKLWILYLNKEKIKGFIANLNNHLGIESVDKDAVAKTILRRTDKDIYMLIKILYIIVVPTVIFWISIPVVDKHDDGDVHTPMRAWFPFDYSHGVIYWIIYIFEGYMLFMYAGSICSIDLVFYGYVNKMCAHFEILEKNIKAVGKSYREPEDVELTPMQHESMYQHLRRIILQHQAIQRQCLAFEYLYNPIVIIHFFGCAFLICVEVFDITMVSSSVNIQLFTQLGYCSSSVIDVYFYCYFGQRLIDKCEDCAFALYDVPWYHMDQKCKKVVLQGMVQAQKPPQMTAYRMFTVDFIAFLGVMKMSYNILALLQQMSDS